MTVPRLVLIEWEDSAQPIGEWQWAEVYDDYRSRVVLCRTTGWLMVDRDDVKVIAQTLGRQGGDGDPQVNGVMQIPARAVVRVVALTEEVSGPSSSSMAPALAYPAAA